MTSSITPNPGIHNMPPLDSGAWTPLDWAQLQAWGATLVTQIEQAIAFALLNVSVLGVKPFAALQAFGQEVLAPVTQLEQLISGIGGAAMADVVALLNEIQLLIDALANGFGLLGSGHTVPDIQGYLAGQAAFISSWVAALAEAGVPTPTKFIELLRGLIPAALPQFNGTAIATAVEGFVDNANGTISYTIQEGQNEVAHLIQQADGTVVTAAQVAHQVVAAAQSAQVAVGQAVATGQQMADHGIAAIEGTVAQAGQTAQAYAAALTGAFAGWVNSWTGQQITHAAAPDVSAAALQAAVQSAAQAAQTAAIQAQLPHFYGGAGTAGLDVQVTFSGGLPGTFTPVSTIAASSAKYNTGATTDAQTVSGVWSATDPYAKYLFLRANSAFTTYCYVKIQNNVPFTQAANCEIGTVVSGVKTVFTTFTLPAPGGLVANSAYTFEVTNYAFSVTGANGLNVTYTDAAPVSQKGALYVYGGFGSDGTSFGKFSANSGTHPYTVPPGIVSGDKFDIVAVGAGGGAQANSGNGGGAGLWNAIALTYGTDFPTSTTSFTVTGGTGGAGGVYPSGTPGNGSASSVAITGYASSPFTAAAGGGGGAGGGSGGKGASPGNETFDNDGYLGGSQSSTFPATGNSPGAGGNSSAFGSGQAGGAGGAGQVLITAVSLTLPGSLASWTFYDSGPSAGPAAASVATGESTASTTFTDLTTTTDQVTVTIGASGMAIVLIYAALSNNTLNAAAYMSCAVSGATTLAAADDRGPLVSASASSTVAGGAPLLYTNLTPGANTFKLKYRVSSGTGTFTNRRIAVIPL